MQAIPSQMILSDGTIDLNGATFIPIDVNGRVLSTKTQTISIVELGKRLLKAASDGDTETVKELMGKGAPFTTDWLGTGPLHFAAMNNHQETCEILLRAGISRDARTKVDRTPLHMAAYEGHAAIVEVLLVSGADVDSKDMLKMTPLHWAVQNGHQDVVALLLRNGADPDAVNKFGKSPVDISVETQRLDVLQMLQFITRDPLDATDSLAIELRADADADTDAAHTDKHAACIELDESLVKGDSVHMETVEELSLSDGGCAIKQESPVELTDSLEMLREHGISFLPNDDSSVVASAVENGHSLVLTDVGRQVLNSTRPLVKVPLTRSLPGKPKAPKVITVTTEQLLAMAGAQKNIFRRLPAGSLDRPLKKIVMKKNKIVLARSPGVGAPSTNRPNRPVGDAGKATPDIESITRQLAEARRQAEEYKQMLRRKEAEAERYKRQLQSIRQQK